MSAAVVVYPVPQSLQALAALAPTVLEYLPIPQSTHVLANVAPALELYLPAVQSTQDPEAKYFPAAQLHALDPLELVDPAIHAGQVVAPALEYVLVAQSEHEAVPGETLNLPPAQSAHAAPVWPLVLLPAAHWAQEETRFEPANEEDPAEQSAQAPAPTAVVYLPVAHGEQTAIPVWPSVDCPPKQEAHADKPAEAE